MPDGARAAVMDWHVGSGVATLAAYSDGAVSMYHSSGGGVIGAGANQAIKAAGLRFFAQLGNLASGLGPAIEYPLPGPGLVTFWLVTPDATLGSGPLPMNDLIAPTHPFQPVMGAAQATITALREQQSK